MIVVVVFSSLQWSLLFLCFQVKVNSLDGRISVLITTRIFNGWRRVPPSVQPPWCKTLGYQRHRTVNTKKGETTTLQLLLPPPPPPSQLPPQLILPPPTPPPLPTPPSMEAKDIAAIACGSFLVLCCTIVMLIHLCRPELLNRKLKEQQDREKEGRLSPQGSEGTPQTQEEMALAELWNPITSGTRGPLQETLLNHRPSLRHTWWDVKQNGNLVSNPPSPIRACLLYVALSAHPHR